jgi:peptide/nickel transport system permease protein
LIREVLPNLTTPLAVETTIRLAWSVSIIAALSFIGYGVQPPFPDWGLMINENRIGLVVQPLSVLAPVVLVAMLAVGVSLVGDGIARATSGVDERVSQ